MTRNALSDTGIAYTIATLVTDRAQHEEMRASFEAGGFTPDDCEYTVIDNTQPPQTCAFRGLNRALAAARGRHVILCHQDVRLLDDDRDRLDEKLTQLQSADPDWALAGNAGAIAPGRLALRISDPHGSNRSVGDLPARVMSLDENFIVVRREARIGFSRDLDGFHFYGADICLNADIMGWSAYVIDFHIEHLSPGNKSADFQASQTAFRNKWAHALRPRWIQTTCALIHVTGDVLDGFVGRLFERPFAGLTRRWPGASGWTGALRTTDKAA